MSNIENLLKTFAKGGASKKKRNNSTAIIYTRVSSKEQTDNMSLDTQLKFCNDYAAKNGFTVCGHFGGTYESAQSDERKQFGIMINFAKNSKEKISTIIVYSLDRFSRSGDNAIWLSGQLREMGIAIKSVVQPIDTSNPSGVLQQNILFLFSKYDNDLRRNRCVTGMKEKLLRGEWIGVPPLGYSYGQGHGRKKYEMVINEEGKFIKKAFLMKINEGIPHTEISQRLHDMGYKITSKRLSDNFRNPFYCGMISHNLLEGELVKGNHPALITRQQFLETHELLSKNASGYKHSILEPVPLKKFIRCAYSGTPFTGYVVKKKNKYYYKSNKIGDPCNRSVDIMHEKFLQVLKSFQLEKEYAPIMTDQLLYLYHSIIDSNSDERNYLIAKIKELKLKHEKLESRFAYGEINMEMFQKFSAKAVEELAPLEEEHKKLDFKLSNPKELIERSVELAVNLPFAWKNGSYQEKVMIQKAVFPEGILFDKKIDDYRTQNVNVVFDVTKRLSNSLQKNKGDNPVNLLELSPSVDPRGRTSNPIETDNQKIYDVIRKLFDK